MSRAPNPPVSRKLGEKMRISARPADTDLSCMRKKWDFCLRLGAGAVTHSAERCTSCVSSSLGTQSQGAQEVDLLQNYVIHSQASQSSWLVLVCFVVFWVFVIFFFFNLGLLQHKWTESKNLISKRGNSTRCPQNKPEE